MIETEELRSILSQKDEEFRHLATTHHDYERRLEELATKPHLTADEEIEEKRLKKEKLHLKDRMEAIARNYRAGALSG
jgi:uncharacterized protein YdcH (DUF465 family)